MSTMAMEVTGTPGACHSNTAWTEPTEQAKGLLPQEKGDTIWGLWGTQPQPEGHPAPLWPRDTTRRSQGDISLRFSLPSTGSQPELPWGKRLSLSEAPPPPFCHPSPPHSRAQLLPACHHAEARSAFWNLPGLGPGVDCQVLTAPAASRVPPCEEKSPPQPQSVPPGIDKAPKIPLLHLPCCTSGQTSKYKEL